MRIGMQLRAETDSALCTNTTALCINAQLCADFRIAKAHVCAQDRCRGRRILELVLNSLSAPMTGYVAKVCQSLLARPNQVNSSSKTLGTYLSGPSICSRRQLKAIKCRCRDLR